MNKLLTLKKHSRKVNDVNLYVDYDFGSQKEETIFKYGCLFAASSFCKIEGGLTKATIEIKPGSIVAQDVNMGFNIKIGFNSAIGKDVNLNNNITIKDSVTIGEGADIKSNVKIFDQTSIGQHVHLGENVIIGENCTIGNFCHIAKDTYIPNDSLILPCTTITEHRVTSSPNISIYQSTTTLGQNSLKPVFVEQWTIPTKFESLTAEEVKETHPEFLNLILFLATPKPNVAEEA